MNRCGANPSIRWSCFLKNSVLTGLQGKSKNLYVPLSKGMVSYIYGMEWSEWILCTKVVILSQYWTYDCVGNIHIWLYLHISNLTILQCESYESKKYPFHHFSPTHQPFQLEAILPFYIVILWHINLGTITHDINALDF